MYRVGVIFFTAAILFFSLVTPSISADVAKIGIVNFQKVLLTSNSGRVAKDEINKKGGEMEQDLKSKGAEIETLKKNLEREVLVMSKEKNEEKQRELRIKVNDFKTLQNSYLKKFKEIETRLVKKIKVEVLEIAAKIGKEGGYLLILEKNEAGTMYFPESIDITDDVINAYNKSAMEIQ